MASVESVQTKLRKLCFGQSYNHSSIQHSFGVDNTHNLCCALAMPSKQYADASGNPIGTASTAIDLDGDLSTSTWSTCMGSNVCSYYAQIHSDGTNALFATSPDLTKLATYIPENIHCEAYAARQLNMSAHGTPGITTYGDPNLCSANQTTQIDAGMVYGLQNVDNWLNSMLNNRNNYN